MLTVYGIETKFLENSSTINVGGCNSAYRLRYWNVISIEKALGKIDWLQQCLPFTVLKHTCRHLHRPTIDALQQCLPFTVLKHSIKNNTCYNYNCVATVLTVYGIETKHTIQCLFDNLELQQCLPFRVLKLNILNGVICFIVATVLTVYGIETLSKGLLIMPSNLRLQQCLPFTVLKQ